MENWTIRKRVLFGFSLLLALALLIGVFGINRISGVHDDVERIAEDWTPSVEALVDIQTAVNDLRRGNVRLLLSAVTGASEEIKTGLAQTASGQADLNRMIADYKKQVDEDIGEGKLYDDVPGDEGGLFQGDRRSLGFRRQGPAEGGDGRVEAKHDSCGDQFRQSPQGRDRF